MSAKSIIGIQNFTAPIICKIGNDGKTYELKVGFYYYRKGNESDKIIVPAGFVSDGFTNLGFHHLVQKFGKGLKCAILHDFLYENGSEMGLNRKDCDKIFLEAMLETRAFCKIKSYFLYFCVRVGAANHYIG